MTLANDNGTDGQTDRQTDTQTDRQSATQYAAPPREEGRIIMTFIKREFLPRQQMRYGKFLRASSYSAFALVKLVPLASVQADRQQAVIALNVGRLWVTGQVWQRAGECSERHWISDRFIGDMTSYGHAPQSVRDRQPRRLMVSQWSRSLVSADVTHHWCRWKAQQHLGCSCTGTQCVS